MLLVLAAAPILTAVILLLIFHQSALRAGFAGLGITLLIVNLVPTYRLTFSTLRTALVYGSLTTLTVAYVLLGGLVFYHILRTAGALDTVAHAIAHTVTDPGRRALLFVLGLSVFFESATGFGIGIVVTAPLFVALGVSPKKAVLLGLLGQCAVPWGALSIGTVLGAELTGVPVERIAWLAPFMNFPFIFLCGGVTLWLIGGYSALRHRLPELTLCTITMVTVLEIASVWVGIELAGVLGGLAVTLFILGITWVTGKRRTVLPDRKLALGWAVLPHGLLLGTLLVTRLFLPLKSGLESIAVLSVPALRFRLPVLYHPGFWMLLVALTSTTFFGLTRTRVYAVLRGAIGQWCTAALAVAGFICLSQVMYAANMTTTLATAVAAHTGQLYIFLLPLIGGLAGFLTGSNAGSNAMFAQFQSAVAAQLDLPMDVVVAAHNAAGSNTTLASPARIILGTAVTEQTGSEGELMRTALMVAGIGLFTLILWLGLWLWTGRGMEKLLFF